MTSTIKDLSVHTKALTQDATIGADSRGLLTFPLGLPSNAEVVGLFLRAGFNLDWIRITLWQNGGNALISYHNEYGGTLSGSFAIVVAYTLN